MAFLAALPIISPFRQAVLPDTLFSLESLCESGINVAFPQRLLHALALAVEISRTCCKPFLPQSACISYRQPSFILSANSPISFDSHDAPAELRSVWLVMALSSSLRPAIYRLARQVPARPCHRAATFATAESPNQHGGHTLPTSMCGQCFAGPERLHLSNILKIGPFRPREREETSTPPSTARIHLLSFQSISKLPAAQFQS